MAVADESPLFKHAGRAADAFTARAHHACEHLVGQKQLNGMRTVAGHQQPARQALVHCVVVQADRLQRQLHLACGHVAAQYF